MLDLGSLRVAFLAAAHVTQMAVVTAAGVWLGSWLDSRFGTDPWLILLCSLVFGAGGMFRLYYGLTHLPDDDDRNPPDAP